MKRALLTLVLVLAAATPAMAHEPTPYPTFLGMLSDAAGLYGEPQSNAASRTAARETADAYRTMLLATLPDPCYQDLYVTTWRLYDALERRAAAEGRRETDAAQAAVGPSFDAVTNVLDTVVCPAEPSSAPSDVEDLRAAAEQVCPVPFRDPCMESYVAIAETGLAAVLCEFPDGRWNIATPRQFDIGQAVGDPCEPDGTVAGVINEGGIVPEP